MLNYIPIMRYALNRSKRKCKMVPNLSISLTLNKSLAPSPTNLPHHSLNYSSSHPLIFSYSLLSSSLIRFFSYTLNFPYFHSLFRFLLLSLSIFLFSSLSLCCTSSNTLFLSSLPLFLYSSFYLALLSFLFSFLFSFFFSFFFVSLSF